MFDAESMQLPISLLIPSIHIRNTQNNHNLTNAWVFDKHKERHNGKVLRALIANTNACQRVSRYLDV